MVTDSLTPAHPAAAELERPPPTARRLAEASISPNTRRAYRTRGCSAVPLNRVWAASALGGFAARSVVEHDEAGAKRRVLTPTKHTVTLMG